MNNPKVLVSAWLEADTANRINAVRTALGWSKTRLLTVVFSAPVDVLVPLVRKLDADRAAALVLPTVAAQTPAEKPVIPWSKMGAFDRQFASPEEAALAKAADKKRSHKKKVSA